jgi:hypothetical protein
MLWLHLWLHSHERNQIVEYICIYHLYDNSTKNIVNIYWYYFHPMNYWHESLPKLGVKP